MVCLLSLNYILVLERKNSRCIIVTTFYAHGNATYSQTGLNATNLLQELSTSINSSAQLQNTTVKSFEFKVREVHSSTSTGSTTSPSEQVANEV